jgi:quinol monooxygenase YgiN
MVIVVATYRTRPEDAATVAAVLGRHAAASEAEPGCLRFAAHQAAEDPTRFVLYEEYVDEQAFSAHRQSDHFVTNIEQTVAPLLTERTWERLTRLNPWASTALPPVT